VHEEKRTAITLFDVRQDKKHMANNDFAVHFFYVVRLGENTRQSTCLPCVRNKVHGKRMAKTDFSVVLRGFGP
jgi:hypothetical protein